MAKPLTDAYWELPLLFCLCLVWLIILTRAYPQFNWSYLNGLKMAKFCQTSSNSWLISRYYLRYFPRLTAIYLIFMTIFKMRTHPKIARPHITLLLICHDSLPHRYWYARIVCALSIWFISHIFMTQIVMVSNIFLMLRG